MPDSVGGPAHLSTELERLAAACRSESVTLGGLLPGLTPRNQALLTAALSAAFCHPIPLPGLSTIAGLIIVIAGSRMALGLGLWVPQRWTLRPLPGRRLEKVFSAGAALMRRCERVIKPRGRVLSAHPLTQRVSGGAIALCGVFLAMPAPPGTAMPPALAILLLSIGTLEEDLLFLAAGYLALIFNLAFFSAIVLLGWEGIKALRRFLF